MFVLLTIIGGYVGLLINICIHQLGRQQVFTEKQRRPNLPQPVTPPLLVQLGCWLPVVGWWLLPDRGELPANRWRYYWLRPMFIELVWMVGLPGFYYWHQQFGLTGGVPVDATSIQVCFVGQTCLLALLFVATFIDLDYRVIPDSITVTGTMAALVLAGLYPQFRLPQVLSGLGGPTVVSVHFADAAPLPTWHLTTVGLMIGLLVYATWILALLPKFPLAEWNWKGLKFVLASTVRFLKANRLRVRRKYRRIGMFYLTLGVVGLGAILYAWFQLPAVNWTSLFGSLVGLGFGGLMVWLVRVVASHALRQEAMGFGDVTLMAMLGAFLGWQAALIIFTISPFAALAVVAVNYLITKDNQLAFGPYLCLAAATTVLAWNSVWPATKYRFFINPIVLWSVLGLSLFLLMFMLIGIRNLKTGRQPT